MSSVAQTFRALHEAPGIFVMPNPWDIGSARILAAMGFPALATTSAGMAFSLGLPEGATTPQQTIEHCRMIVSATPLPVSADLENGFGDTPESAADTIRRAGETGLAGASIEDFTGRPADPIYDFPLAVERIAAAVEAARALPDDFVLTARAENLLHGRIDLDDTIKRLQAFEAAGADVLYAPGLPDLESIRTVCQSVSRPVNVVMGLPGARFTVDELAEAGVKRISIGAALARVAYGAFINAARDIQGSGTFDALAGAIGFAEIGQYFAGQTAPNPA